MESTRIPVLPLRTSPHTLYLSLSIGFLRTFRRLPFQLLNRKKKEITLEYGEGRRFGGK